MNKTKAKKEVDGIVSGGGGASGKGRNVLSWISLGAGLIGGSALAATFVGALIAGFVGLFPAWIASGLFAVGLIALVLDCALDRTPNRLAIWMAILLPSIARAIDGKLGQAVRDLAGRVSDAANAQIGAWLGDSSVVAIAAFGVAVALLVAKRVVRKGAH